jgi:hypothetical protein
VEETENKFKGLVERGGAVFVGIRGDSVVFTDHETHATLTLYKHALRSIEDVELALKSVREPVVGFEPLLAAEKSDTWEGRRTMDILERIAIQLIAESENQNRPVNPEGVTEALSNAFLAALRKKSPDEVQIFEAYAGVIRDVLATKVHAAFDRWQAPGRA